MHAHGHITKRGLDILAHGFFLPPPLSLSLRSNRAVRFRTRTFVQHDTRKRMIITPHQRRGHSSRIFFGQRRDQGKRYVGGGLSNYLVRVEDINCELPMLLLQRLLRSHCRLLLHVLVKMVWFNEFIKRPLFLVLALFLFWRRYFTLVEQNYSINKQVVSIDS